MGVAGCSGAVKVMQVPGAVCTTVSPPASRELCQSQYLKAGAMQDIIAERGSSFCLRAKENESAVFHQSPQQSHS